MGETHRSPGKFCCIAMGPQSGASGISVGWWWWRPRRCLFFHTEVVEPALLPNPCSHCLWYRDERWSPCSSPGLPPMFRDCTELGSSSLSQSQGCTELGSGLYPRPRVAQSCGRISVPIAGLYGAGVGSLPPSWGLHGAGVRFPHPSAGILTCDPRTGRLGRSTRRRLPGAGARGRAASRLAGRPCCRPSAASGAQSRFRAEQGGGARLRPPLAPRPPPPPGSRPQPRQDALQVPT